MLKVLLLAVMLLLSFSYSFSTPLLSDDDCWPPCPAPYVCYGYECIPPYISAQV
ncbi:unnamed protein product [Callosobruchus maculatus]|uniref:Uncharacterized protein n=1 Tax=Callosobruchus maculatus TaxID=64391 RepID=A0A653BGU6_CALMS|nr:unnamed protein product [Callosobruchus maculatus]